MRRVEDISNQIKTNYHFIDDTRDKVKYLTSLMDIRVNIPEERTVMVDLEAQEECLLEARIAAWLELIRGSSRRREILTSKTSILFLTDNSLFMDTLMTKI